ncbi:MAG: PAS domain S-box protein [Candidatus Eremiobacteraeota bacterium]|nr:PAS domain S-box protein [Candidatus Eremiobacteraeota bacterium]
MPNDPSLSKPSRSRRSPERLGSPEELQVALEAIPVAMLTVDGSGMIVQVNALLEKLFGYERRELLGRPIELLVPERFRSRHPEHRHLYFASPAPRAMGAGRELYGLLKDGREVPVEIGLNPLITRAGTYTLASIVDISERRRAEERLRLTLETAPVAILMMDRAGIIAMANAQTEQILGYGRGELIGKSIESLVPDRFRSRHPDHRAGFFANPQQRSMGVGRELYALRRDGREVPVEIGLNPVKTDEGLHVLASIIDITERKAAEESKDRLLKAVTETSQELASAAQQILAASSQQSTGAQEQAAGVSQTVATVDEVTQTSEQAAHRLKAVADASQRTAEIGEVGRKSVEEAVSVMGGVRGQVESLAESILVLAEQAQQIGEIIATVNEIAEQTNLLALNAAIEAARAGEHGRGFSVVASEVKALAEQSKKATSQVRQILSAIQKATNSAVMATEDGSKSVNGAIKVVDQAGEAIRLLTDTINQSAQSAAQVAASAGQQAAGMAQIHQAMKSISLVATQNLAATKETERAARDLNLLGTRLGELLAGYGR